MGRGDIHYASKKFLRQLKTRTWKFCRQYFQHIPKSETFSPDEWMRKIEENNTYSMARRLELMRTILNLEPATAGWSYKKVRRMFAHMPNVLCYRRLRENEKAVKMFIKKEGYVKINRPRGIYSRSDLCKPYIGAVIKKIEEQIYGLKFFIKKIPVKDRPAYLKEQIDGEGKSFWVIDYTAFESTFVVDLMEAVEGTIYKFMLINHPLVYQNLTNTLFGTNKIYSRYVSAKIEGRRMSGEMNTSMANGISNIIFIKFLGELLGTEIDDFVVEGDDSLISTHYSIELTPEHFKLFGVGAEIEKYETFSEGSFCGLVADSQDLEALTDPFEALLKFGWTHSCDKFASDRVLAELLRAKSLSLAYEYPSCPILYAVASKYINLTSGHKARLDNNWWERQLTINPDYDPQIIKSRIKPPTDRTRAAFALKYHVPVETQKELEEYVLGLESVKPFDDDPVGCWMRQYAEQFWPDTLVAYDMYVYTMPDLTFRKFVEA
jgi:hypothetical protein